jgi:hypothetical protein
MIVREGVSSRRWTLCRLPQKKADDDDLEANDDNSLGTFKVDVGKLTFAWIDQRDPTGRKCQDWFGRAGFVLRLTSATGSRYFALYQPRFVDVEIKTTTSTGLSSGTINPKELGSVSSRDLRLGSGRVEFEGGSTRSFDEAPGDGSVSMLKGSSNGGREAEFEVQLQKKESRWRLKITPTPPTTAPSKVESAADGPADPSVPDGAVARPRMIWATLYRRVDVDGVQVRIDEVIVGDTKPPRGGDSAAAVSNAAGTKR